MCSHFMHDIQEIYIHMYACKYVQVRTYKNSAGSVCHSYFEMFSGVELPLHCSVSRGKIHVVYNVLLQRKQLQTRYWILDDLM